MRKQSWKIRDVEAIVETDVKIRDAEARMETEVKVRDEEAVMEIDVSIRDVEVVIETDVDTRCGSNRGNVKIRDVEAILETDMKTKVKVRDEEGMMDSNVKGRDVEAMMETEVKVRDEEAMMVKIRDEEPIMETDVKIRHEEAMVETDVRMRYVEAFLETGVKVRDLQAILETDVKVRDGEETDVKVRDWEAIVELVETNVKVRDMEALVGTEVKVRDAEAVMETDVNVRDGKAIMESGANDEASVVESEEDVSDGSLATNYYEEERSSERPLFLEKWRTEFDWIRSVEVDGETRIKCILCESCDMDNCFGVGDGTASLERTVLIDHSESADHHHATMIYDPSEQNEMASDSSSMEAVEEHMIDEKERVIIGIKSMHFIAKRSRRLDSYKELCMLLRITNTPNMPALEVDDQYADNNFGIEFLKLFARHMKDAMIVDLHASPFFSIFIIQNIDKISGKYFIFLVTYLEQKGLGPPKTTFLSMKQIESASTQVLHNCWKKIQSRYSLENRRLCAVGIDRCAYMLEYSNGFTEKLKRNVPHLIEIPCFAHRAALVIPDAVATFPEMRLVNKVVKHVYAWLRGFYARNEKLQKLLQQMHYEILDALPFEKVCWITKFKTMKRICKLLPSILTKWQDEKPLWYEQATIFKALFCIHMLADVLLQFNVFISKLEEDKVDIIEVVLSMDALISALAKTYTIPESFAADTKYLSTFLGHVNRGQWEFEDVDGDIYRHEMLFQSIPLSKPNNNGGEEPMNSSNDINCDGSIEHCKDFAKNFALKVLDILQTKFPDLSLFRSLKLFSPSTYQEDAVLRYRNARECLDNIMFHLDCVASAGILDYVLCEQEVYLFVDTLWSVCRGLGLKEAWLFVAGQEQYHRLFPNMIRLWQVILVLPTETKCCNTGFSIQEHMGIQNHMTDALDTNLPVSILKDYLRVNLDNGQLEDDVDFDGLWSLWNYRKGRLTQCSPAQNEQHYDHSSVVL